MVRMNVIFFWSEGVSPEYFSISVEGVSAVLRNELIPLVLIAKSSMSIYQ